MAPSSSDTTAERQGLLSASEEQENE